MTLDALKTSLSDRYRIERELGAGGMATVYLAEDLKHGRKVAIKVLRPELAAVIGAERFLREIKTIANLQHSHILGLIDSGVAELGRGSRVEGPEDPLDSRPLTLVYYVMPFVEGESLRDRLNREKQLSIAEVVRLASEIASALDYAHRHGVIHRDIKPENILLHDGQALVADFGIALAVSSAGGSRMTETGLSLGTPHYMSPEQAMGERTVTARTDIYALGCVTYEMLTGDPPFTGSTAQAIVAKMMTEKPTPPSRVRDTVPAEVEDAVLTALAKLPADRFASAAEFSAALGGQGGSGAATRPLRSSLPRRPAAPPVVYLGLLAVIAAFAAWGWWRRGPAEPPQVVRFEVQPTHGTQFAFPIAGVGTEVALSADGRQAVYAASTTGGSWKLYLTTIDQLGARVLPGTDGAFFPEFSPDGRWIAFWAADGWLKKIGVDGNGLTTLCRLENSGPNAAGLTWISDHDIVFSPGIYTKEGGLLRISSDGGTPVRFAQLDSASGERLQLSPRAADRGRLVFYSSTIASNADLAIGVIETASGKTRVFPDLRGARPLGLIDDYLIFVRGDGALMAAPFDTRKLRAGAPLQIADSITVPSSSWGVPAALSPNGALLYQKGGTASQLVTVDQHGGARPLVDSVQVYLHPRLSPDGRRLAVEVQGASGADIWIIDLISHTTERLTNEGYNNRPEWSPDGSRVLYTSSRAPANALWSQPADGSAGGTLLFKSSEPIREGVFTPDGKAIVYRQDRAETARDIYLVPLGGNQQPVPLLVSPSDEKQPRVSPDSRWLAYVSNESGREEVYVRALSATGGRVPVSTAGGGEPLWSRDGKRLFYRVGSRVLAATIATSPSLAVTGRDTLFDGPYATDLYHPDYDVMPDGKSFLMVRPVDDNRQLVMVVNWVEELRRRTAKGR